MKKAVHLLDTSVGTPFVWLVWALKPGEAHLAAICTEEAKADRYVESLPAGGGLSYQGAKMFKEHVPMDHAFGWRDSIVALAQRQPRSS